MVVVAVLEVTIKNMCVCARKIFNISRRVNFKIFIVFHCNVKLLTIFHCALCHTLNINKENLYVKHNNHQNFIYFCYY